jgi:hypothetical protein
MLRSDVFIWPTLSTICAQKIKAFKNSTLKKFAYIKSAPMHQINANNTNQKPHLGALDLKRTLLCTFKYYSDMMAREERR